MKIDIGRRMDGYIMVFIHICDILGDHVWAHFFHCHINVDVVRPRGTHWRFRRGYEFRPHLRRSHIDLAISNPPPNNQIPVAQREIPLNKWRFFNGKININQLSMKWKILQHPVEIAQLCKFFIWKKNLCLRLVLNWTIGTQVEQTLQTASRSVLYKRSKKSCRTHIAMGQNCSPKTRFSAKSQD